MAESQKSAPRIVIIGAGMSGILMAHRLKQAGLADLTLYEKGDSVGGTWRENSYPGLHCDVPSHHYCYSFAPNPGWSRQFSPGPEIRDYFKRQAEEFDVARHVRFNSEIVEARWDGSQWRIELRDGATDHADILVSATGFLHQLHYPEIAGLETFNGAKFHTARWDHSVALENKRIGIVGTGSTAVQLISALAGKVRKLHLFQRTAQWVLFAPNPAFTAEQQDAFRHDPQLMRDLYEETRMAGRLLTDGIMYAESLSRAELIRNVEENLAKVKDPELRRRLTPDYKLGCKRLIMSPDFYEAIQRPDTELVDEGIERVVPAGILTRSGRLIELDVLVLATGYNAAAYIRPVRLYGEDGVSLDDVWAKRPVAYQTMTVPHMPNFFMIGGPYSPVGNISLVLVSELQVEWIMKCIDRIVTDNISMAPKQDATDAMVADFRDAARNTVWATGGCSSWYLDAEGVPAIYPYPAAHFQDSIAHGPELRDFEVRELVHQG